MKKLRVLLITREPWRDDSNEGSVLSGWFQEQTMELAQIYCKPGTPQNVCCDRYFQLTDSMAVKNLLHHEPMGQIVSEIGQSSGGAAQAHEENKSFYDFFRKNNWASFHFIRECLWSLANWESTELEQFVDGFAPDVIFAPFCYNRYVLAIQRWAAKRTRAPMVGVIWDDLYSLQQRSFSPVFWLNRFLQRSAIRKTAALCSYLYALCDEQSAVFSKQLKREVRTLPKTGEIAEAAETEAEPAQEVRLIYAGGVYYGRLQTLEKIVKVLKKLNQEGHPCRLDVYTASPGMESLEVQDVCQLHPTISMEELRRRYRESQIALHIEGFDPKNARVTQYSFSSKIVDCLCSSCAVLAVCPERNLGFQYLRRLKAAVCVCNRQELEEQLRKLVCDKGWREHMSQQALECVKAHHDPVQIRRQLQQELEKAEVAE